MAMLLEFEIDRVINYQYPWWISGHRAFVVNVLLGASASGAITGLTTWITVKYKDDIIKNHLNLSLHSIRELFDEYCEYIKLNDYENLLFYMGKFEDEMSRYSECLAENNVKDKKYKDIEDVYCEKIAEFSTTIMQYDGILNTGRTGNQKLLFLNASEYILKDKDVFLDAIWNVIGERKKDNSFENMVEQLDEIERLYFDEESN